jgi:integrase
MSQKKSGARHTGWLFQKTNSKTGEKSEYWTLQYYREGNRVREAAHTKNKSVAQKLLSKRLTQVDEGDHFEPSRAKAIKISALYEALLAQTKMEERSKVRDAEALGLDRRVKRPRGVVLLEQRWKNHLGPFFGHKRAASLSTDDITAYQLQRQEVGVSNGAINRELGHLRRAFYLGRDSTPPKVKVVPKIKNLPEGKPRQGFVEDTEFNRLIKAANNLFERLFLELAFSYGWRRSEMLGLRVNQINFADRTIRLHPGSTKNGEGREVTMTAKVEELLRAAVAGKEPKHFVLTREGQEPDKPVSDFRVAWGHLCARAGVGKWVCAKCDKPVAHVRCKCGGKRRYEGLICHDMRRSAAKRLRAAGVPESVVQAIGGWLTNGMFRRYAIVSGADQRAAIKMLEEARERNAAAQSGSLPGPSAPEIQPKVN